MKFQTYPIKRSTEVYVKSIMHQINLEDITFVTYCISLETMLQM